MTSRASTCAGKVLVMLNNDPDWDPKLFEGQTRLYYGAGPTSSKAQRVMVRPASSSVHTTPSAGYPWQVVQSSWGGEQFELPAEGEPRIQLKGWATEDASRRLLKAGGADLDKLVEAAKKRSFKPVADRPANIHQASITPVSRVRTPTWRACCRAAIRSSRTKW
jgi:hypothetical protein